MGGIKNSNIPWVGDIPKHWNLIHNKYLFDCGKEIVGSLSNSTQLLSLTTKGVVRKEQDITGGKVPESYDTYQIVEENSIILCLFDLDCSAVFSGISKFRGMISPAYKVVSCRDSILPKFADYWFKYIFDGRKYKQYSKNLRFTLSYDEFGALTSILPPIAEQQRIADFLDRKCADIDNILEKTRSSIEEYKKLKQSVITEAVTKGVRGPRPMKDSGIEWIGLYPEDWTLTKVKWLLNERNERSEDGSEEPLSMSQKYGLIPTKDMDTIPNMASSFVGAKITHVGDLVFNKLKAHLGVFAVSKYEGLVSPDYAVYYKTARADMRYLEYLFKTPQYILEFRKRSSGVGAGLTRLYTGDLFAMYSASPSLEEQQEIALYLDQKCSEIDSLIASKEKFITELESYKKSLIYEYVTGKKEVPAEA